MKSTKPAAVPVIAAATGPFLSTAEAATILKKTPNALAVMRWRGESPPFAKVGRAVIYPRDRFFDWIESRLRTSTSSPPRAAE